MPAFSEVPADGSLPEVPAGFCFEVVEAFSGMSFARCFSRAAFACARRDSVMPYTELAVLNTRGAVEAIPV